MSYDASTGQPSVWTVKGGEIYLYPIPDKAYDIEIEYYRDPAVITSLTDEVEKEMVIPVTFYV
jgi:hypothetical protein